MAYINGNWEFTTGAVNTGALTTTTTAYPGWTYYCARCNSYSFAWQTHVCQSPPIEQHHCCHDHSEAVARRVVELLNEQKKAKKRAQ